MPDYFIPLEPGCVYHIFNRGNNGDKLFYQPRNYTYFLDKLHLLLNGFLKIYAYCLLPNHFHLIISVREEWQWPFTLQKEKPGDTVSEQFRKFFLGYATALKKQEGRTGSLFEKNFKRIKISNRDYFRYSINYVHQNPSKHSIVADYSTYPWSSFASIVQGSHSWLEVAQVIRQFGGKDQFIEYHNRNEVISRD